LISLAAQKDSQINKRIAEESKNIASDTRKDSESMKTIAVLTMAFLPGTFVSAVLSMNFFDSTSGEFVVHSKWWIFPTVTIPLTLAVVGLWAGWILWKNQLAADRKEAISSEKSDNFPG
jgi:Mg2+ and Co2+ transporter CorA